MSTPEYASIAELAARWGKSVPCAGNLPVKLDDPNSVWSIEQGAIDLFLVEFKNGVEQTAPQHLLRAEAGGLLPGVAPDEEDTTLSLIAQGTARYGSQSGARRQAVASESGRTGPAG